MIWAKSAHHERLADETDVEEITSNVGRKPTRAHEEFGIAKGKNLVLISLESTQNFVINQKINGEEITPFLNDFIKNSYYFNASFMIKLHKGKLQMQNS